MGMPSASSTCKMPTCARPRANPPPIAMPMRGRAAGESGCRGAALMNASLKARTERAILTRFRMAVPRQGAAALLYRMLLLCRAMLQSTISEALAAGELFGILGNLARRAAFAPVQNHGD